MAKTINEEFDEAEAFDSYEEPEQEVAPTEQETVASDEEIAAEDEQIDVEPVESPSMDVESLSETTQPEVTNPDISDATVPASQVTEPSLPPDDEEVLRSPGVSPPPEPGEAGLELDELPDTEETDTLGSTDPRVPETGSEGQVRTLGPADQRVVSDTDPDIVESTVYTKPVSVEEFTEPVVNQENLDAFPESGSEGPATTLGSVDQRVSDDTTEPRYIPESVPEVDTESGEITGIHETPVESPGIDEPTSPSASDEPLSAPPVTEDNAYSETLQDAADTTAGFQGEVTHPDVPEVVYQLQQELQSDPAGQIEQNVFRQMESSQRQSEELARTLAAELDPMWEQLRNHQEYTVRDYFQQQLWTTTIIGRIK